MFAGGEKLTSIELERDADQYRARKRSILTVKIEEQNKKNIDLSHCL